MSLLGTAHYHDPSTMPADYDASAPWSLTCPDHSCSVEMYGETPAAAEDSMVAHLRQWHPHYAAVMDLAGAIAAELYAQLEELSDDSTALIDRLAGADDALHDRLTNLADDLRETLIVTLDVRLSDWLCDNT